MRLYEDQEMCIFKDNEKMFLGDFWQNFPLKKKLVVKLL